MRNNTSATPYTNRVKFIQATAGFRCQGCLDLFAVYYSLCRTTTGAAVAAWRTCLSGISARHPSRLADIALARGEKLTATISALLSEYHYTGGVEGADYTSAGEVRRHKCDKTLRWRCGHGFYQTWPAQVCQDDAAALPPMAAVAELAPQMRRFRDIQERARRTSPDGAQLLPGAVPEAGYRPETLAYI